MFLKRMVCFDGTVPRVSYMFTLLTANRHPFSHLFDVIINTCCCVTPSWIQWFRISKEKQLIQELLAYAKDATNPAAKELALWIDEDAVIEWLHDDIMPTIHHYTNSESVHIFVSPEKNGSEEESSDKNEEGVRERISIDWLIKNCSNFLLQYIQHIYKVREQNINNLEILQIRQS